MSEDYPSEEYLSERERAAMIAWNIDKASAFLATWAKGRPGTMVAHYRDSDLDQAFEHIHRAKHLADRRA